MASTGTRSPGAFAGNDRIYPAQDRQHGGLNRLKGDSKIFKFLKRLLMPGGDSAEARTWLDKISNEKRGETTVIACARIVLLEAKGDNVLIHTADNSWSTPGAISHFERSLDPKVFLRIHRSTIINKRKIARVSRLAEGRLNFHMNNDKVDSSSENYQDAISKALPDLA